MAGNIVGGARMQRNAIIQAGLDEAEAIKTTLSLSTELRNAGKGE
jgi:hypothetical protein